MFFTHKSVREGTCRVCGDHIVWSTCVSSEVSRWWRVEFESTLHSNYLVVIHDLCVSMCCVDCV